MNIEYLQGQVVDSCNDLCVGISKATGNFS